MFELDITVFICRFALADFGPLNLAPDKSQTESLRFFWLTNNTYHMLSQIRIYAHMIVWR
jgi:hypothetical protein